MKTLQHRCSRRSKLKTLFGAVLTATIAGAVHTSCSESEWAPLTRSTDCIIVVFKCTANYLDIDTVLNEHVIRQQESESTGFHLRAGISGIMKVGITDRPDNEAHMVCFRQEKEINIPELKSMLVEKFEKSRYVFDVFETNDPDAIILDNSSSEHDGDRGK